MPSTSKSPVLKAIALILISIVGLTLSATRGFSGTGLVVENNGAVPLLVKSRAPLTPDVISSLTLHAARVSQTWPQIRAMAVTVQAKDMADFLANPLLETVEPDVQAGIISDVGQGGDTERSSSVVVPLSTASSPIQTWNQDMADTPGTGRTGAGVTVAVVDAGLPQNWDEFLPPNCVDLEHAAGFGAEGWGDFHSQNNAIRGVGGHIGLFPHGLAVSSVIVGFPSDFGPIGGAAPDVKILPVRCLNQFNSGWYSWFTAAILYVADLKATGAIPGPMVINFSIQGHSSSQVLADAIDYAISQGVLFVTIAGNFHPFDTVSFPGRMPESITAAAAGWNSEGLPPNPWFFGDVPEGDASQVYMASFSGREAPFVPPASQIDVVAPGSYVFGEWLYGPGFSEGREVAFRAVDNFIFGTSFAAPHVAGIVAQMLEKNPGLTQSDAEAILRGSALPIPPSASLYFTPLGEPVLPWDARATGAGLAQGGAAVSATPVPLAALIAGRTRLDVGTPGGHSLSLRITSPAGSLPVEFSLRGFPEGRYTASVFDVQGRLVRRWESQAGKEMKASWSGTRDDGSAARSGVYFLKAESAAGAAAARVVVVR